MEFSILFEYEVPGNLRENQNDFLSAKSLPEWDLQLLLYEFPCEINYTSRLVLKILDAGNDFASLV